MSKAIEVRDLHKSYRKGFFLSKTPVLKGLNFSVPKGSITGFLGGNGAGKTTTLKCLLDLVIPDSGEILFFGEGPLTLDRRRRIGFLPEHPYFYEYLTGLEFLTFYGQLSTRLSKTDLSEKIKKLLKRVRLEEAATKPLRTYSKGMRQRIGMAQALIHKPDLLILDEPMGGLDPDGRIEMNNLIREAALSGSTIFFSSHLLHDAEVLCQNLVIIKEGKLIYEGVTKGLLQGLQTGYSITYLEQGKPLEKKVSTLEQLQKSIDEVRGQRKEILEVRNEQPSLELAFAKVAGPAQREQNP